MKMLIWMTVIALAVTAAWLHVTWHRMDPKMGLARTGREPIPIRRLHPRVQQEIEEQVGNFT